MADFTFLRRALDLIFPEGPPYEPDIDGDMSKLRDGDAENLASIRADVQDLKYIRNPALTPVLSDLEREFGVNPQATLTEAERRTLLRPQVYKRKTTGSTGDLQKRLDDGGFDLTVYDNSPNGPAIDPAIILEQNFQMQAAAGTNYYAGNTLAYAAYLGGDLLVNGRVFDQARGYFGAGTVWAGNTVAVAGYYEQYVQSEIVYPIPTDPDSWPFVFFVGGDGADINPATGELISIPQGSVPSNKQKQLEDLILKFKPLFTWCGLVVTYT